MPKSKKSRKTYRRKNASNPCNILKNIGTMTYQNILVIRLSAFGDFVLSLGAFEAIRAQHPDAKITLLTTPPFQEMAEKCGFFDTVWVEKRMRWHELGAWKRFRRRLHTENFDAVYDLQRNHRTGIYHRLAPKVTRNQWVGYDLPHGTSAGLFQKGDGVPEGLLRIDDTRDFKLTAFAWLDSDVSRFNLPARYALLIPGCAPQHPQKKWPAANYAVLAADLLKDGITPVVIGGAAEAALAAAIAAHVQGVLNLAGGTSFFDIATIARGASVAVGNDTGPMHMASLVGVPSLWLFSGSSNPAQSAPKGKHIYVQREEYIGDISVTTVLQVVKDICR